MNEPTKSEYEAYRNGAILQAVLKRVKFLEQYTGDHEFHRGCRLAASLIRHDINRARQLIPTKPPAAGGER